MTTIKIQWLQDDHECETCGWSVAEGANVYFDGELVIEMDPCAYCFDGINYEREAVLAAIIKRLGHTIEGLE